MYKLHRHAKIKNTFFVKYRKNESLIGGVSPIRLQCEYQPDMQHQVHQALSNVNQENNHVCINWMSESWIVSIACMTHDIVRAVKRENYIIEESGKETKNQDDQVHSKWFCCSASSYHHDARTMRPAYTHESACK